MGASEYDLSVCGPNGFLRAFKGSVAARRTANLGVHVVYEEESNGIVLEISNQAAHAVTVRIVNGYTHKSTDQRLEPGETQAKRWSLTRMGGWYDLAITVDGDAGFAYRVAGHLETGEDSMSDPIMGGLV
jgi:phospholipase C